MQHQNKIIIIGGGLAGLTAALHLQKLDFEVTLIEKYAYPHHKVCGEYVSNEVLPYLNWLEISFAALGPTEIDALQFSAVNGKSLTAKLPLGGFGLSRYAMDNHLYQKLLERNVTLIQDTVIDVNFEDDYFTVKTLSGGVLNATQVIGAFGKRANLDVKLQRSFILEQSPYMAVKAHYKGDFPANLVALHNFKGGYCGVSKVENEQINICYLANYQSFKKYKNILSFQQEVIYKNRFMKDIFENSTRISQAPLTIGQISFRSKAPVEGHMLMIGDSAALIHPLCGNGMAMAIHSAKIVSEMLADTKDKNYTRAQLEDNYTRAWKNQFAARIRTGKILSSLLRNDMLQSLVLNTVIKMPNLLHRMIALTHGKPISM